MEARFAAILLMGGEGRRLGSPIPKQFLQLGPQKIYQHTLEIFLATGLFSEIVLVCHPHWIEQVRAELPESSTLKVVAGGPTRQASSFLGLQACSQGTDFVMIHDAVRPFVSRAILERNWAAVQQHRAVDTCIPSADTLVYAPGSQFIASIPPRHAYLRGQTPQTFAFQLICEAHQKTRQTEATDDCSLVLELGHPVAVVEGEEDNIKITTELDVEMAELTLHKHS